MTRTKDDFVTRGSRLGFIRKVYAIFSAQMLSTIAVTYVIMNNRNLAQLLLQNYQPIAIGSLLASTGIVVALVSNPALRYTSPVNFILLGIHTLLQSIMVGSFSSLLNPRTVCLGTIHTLTAFAAIALYTFQPNPQYDFTVLGNTLLTALTSLVVGSVLGAFYHMPLYDNLLSGALAVLFAVYLFHDMQKIVGGTHRKHQYGQKEYILAALNLYQDAISLYMQIAKMLHEQDKRKRRDD
jgi:FtsH-binding integral membrane protein